MNTTKYAIHFVSGNSPSHISRAKPICSSKANMQLITSMKIHRVTNSRPYETGHSLCHLACTPTANLVTNNLQTCCHTTCKFFKSEATCSSSTASWVLELGLASRISVRRSLASSKLSMERDRTKVPMPETAPVPVSKSCFTGDAVVDLETGEDLPSVRKSLKVEVLSSFMDWHMRKGTEYG